MSERDEPGHCINCGAMLPHFSVNCRECDAQNQNPKLWNMRDKITRLTKERDDLREALQRCLYIAVQRQTFADSCAALDRIEFVTSDALANLNKTDGE